MHKVTSKYEQTKFRYDYNLGYKGLKNAHPTLAVNMKNARARYEIR